jgi:outer membrane murein-binding lipoprotein Lpp
MATLAELAVQGIITLGGGTAVAAGINGYFSRRVTRATVTETQARTGKTAAEVTSVGVGASSVQVDTSLKLMQWMDGQLDDLRADFAAARAEATAARAEAAEARSEIDLLRGWRGQQETLNATHGEWDALVTARLAEKGINVPPPPPLHPHPSV